MLFRFTLNNTIEGSHVISDPDGWKDINLKLERNPEFHSLVELIEIPLIFYRSSDSVDGGYDYIVNVEQTQGVDALVEILIEVSDDQGETYDTFFNGLLQLETINDISDAEFYKLECEIVRNDFWSKFINRKSQQVNLSADVSLDEEELIPVSDIEIQLPSQIVNKQSLFSGDNSGTVIFSTGLQLARYSNIGLELIQAEIIDTFTIPFSLQPSAPTVNVIECTERGDITINVFGGMRFVVNVTGGAVADITGFIHAKLNSGSEITVATATLSYGPPLANISDTLQLTGTHTFTGVNPGDLVYIYARWLVAVDTSPATTVATMAFRSMNITVIQKTTYIDTATDAFILRDAAESILSKTISRDNVLFSNYLGDETPTACGANFAIMKGLHVRGYSMFDKPMFMSFEDWWAGANPIFNLGLGYETIGGTEYIRIEDKAHFYDETIVMTFDNVEKIIRTYDKEAIFKKIEIGYQKWSAESASGIDDPQTKHTYNTRFKIIGRDESILSKFIAASLAIEQTRRNRIEFGKDWRLDDDTIIIALSNDSSPYQPELDEDFTDIVNLLNSETRYNIRLTPARNFERWKPLFNGCLQTYVDNSPCEPYKFASGEGNYDTVTTGDGFCDSGRLAENQDICATDSYYFTHVQYEFEVPLSFQDYKILRDNRNNAIAVSNTTTNHKTCFIDKLEYDHFNAIGKFNVWLKDTDFNF